MTYAEKIEAVLQKFKAGEEQQLSKTQLIGMVQYEKFVIAGLNIAMRQALPGELVDKLVESTIKTSVELMEKHHVKI